MSTAVFGPAATMNLQASEPAETTDLNRSASAPLLERLGPLVLEHDVTLDLTGVVRIDAAGISALLTLYCRAREGGNHFSLINVPARVVEILSVVGLDRLLVSHNVIQKSQYESGLSRSAA